MSEPGLDSHTARYSSAALAKLLDLPEGAEIYAVGAGGAEEMWSFKYHVPDEDND